MRHFTQVLLPFLVRLACVRHAASVDSEPGSNSRLKPDVLPSLTEVRVGSTASAHLFLRTGCAQILLPCENDQAKLDPFSRLACSTNLSKILPAGSPERGRWIEAQALKPGCPRTCLRYLPGVLPHTWPFLREPSKSIELWSRCQGLISSAPKAVHAAQNIKHQPATNARATKARGR